MTSDSPQWLNLGPFTVFDLETTGMSPVYGRIVEIGAVRIECDGSRSRFETLVNPVDPIPSHASAIHGITNDMVRDAPLFREAAEAFLEFARDSKLVAHNARFDLSFMQENLARVGLTPLGGTYDTIALTRKAYPGLPSYSLPSLVQTFALETEYPGQAHRAGYDAELTSHLFAVTMKRLYELYPEL